MKSISWGGEALPQVVLGTVQLGLNYGIANTQGQPDQANAENIVRTAWEAGITHFDTAQAYGTSEAVLGRALHNLGIAGQAQVESKLDAALDLSDAQAVEASIEQTLAHLGVTRLWALLFHRAEGLDAWDDGAGGVLLRVKERGWVEHLGVSVNRPEEVLPALAHPHMEIVQLAANAWDRRLDRLGAYEAAREAGRLILIRSIYLQGILTMAPEAVAQRLAPAEAAARAWTALALELGASPVELAVRYAASLGWPLVVGADAPEQIGETVRMAALTPLDSKEKARVAAAVDPHVFEELLTPSEWPRLQASG